MRITGSNQAPVQVTRGPENTIDAGISLLMWGGFRLQRMFPPAQRSKGTGGRRKEQRTDAAGCWPPYHFQRPLLGKRQMT